MTRFSANRNSAAGFAVAIVSTLFTLVTGHLNVKDMASQHKFKSTADVLESVLADSSSEDCNIKSTADVLESVLADSSSEDCNSIDSSSEGEDFHSQSSDESSASDDVGDLLQ